MEDSPCFYTRDRVSDCSPLRPGTQESTNSRTGAPHTFVERMTQKRKGKERERRCCTQTLALNTLGWRLTGNGWETGVKCDKWTHQGWALCGSVTDYKPWHEVQPREREKALRETGRGWDGDEGLVSSISDQVLHLLGLKKSKLRIFDYWPIFISKCHSIGSSIPNNLFGKKESQNPIYLYPTFFFKCTFSTSCELTSGWKWNTAAGCYKHRSTISGGH